MENENNIQQDEFDDLFIDKSEVIDKKLLKDSIVRYVKLTNEGTPILEKEFYSLNNTQKVIVFLLIRKVLKLKEMIVEEEIGPTDIGNSIGLPIGSVKSVFHFTQDNIFLSIKGKYKLPDYAIKKAASYLSGNINDISIKTTKKPTKKGNTRVVISKKVSENENISKIKDNLNRTEFPNIYELKSVGDQATYLLKIVKEKIGIDGLTPPEISFVLTNIFRIPVTRQAVSVALNSKKYIAFVHRLEVNTKGVLTYIYKLMKPGEDYLQELIK